MKKCKLIDYRTRWTMEVDGKQIKFNGEETANDYADKYAAMGYDVEFIVKTVKK